MNNNINQFTNQLKDLSFAVHNVVDDIAVLASDMFDRNFETQSFFGQKWTPSQYVQNENIKRGKSRNLLQRTGHLRKSLQHRVNGRVITFTSNVPYAEIHNSGGTINHPGGTAYFYNRKKKQTIWISNRKASGKGYARTKPHDIPIPQRQFIGNNQQLENEIAKHIESVITKIMK